jgi:5'-nucleotidase
MENETTFAVNRAMMPAKDFVSLVSTRMVHRLRRLWCFFVVLLWGAFAHAQDARVVHLLHFSDYHSHARPFQAGGERRAGGIARAIAWLRPWSERDDALIFNGGDMLNHGAPSWSDRHGCVEWPWLDGIVDAMAYGNHDADNGTENFERCRRALRYPILGANVLTSDGRERLFDVAGKPYVVFTANGVRVGVFAVVGSDFDRLIPLVRRPSPGAVFTDRVAAAREVVTALREQEHVDVVALIGHAHVEEDHALARAVPGIDVIFGTHSHRRVPLARVPETNTWFLSPFQYLEYISHVAVTVENHRVTRVKGGLERMGARLPEDPDAARHVTALQRVLETDPSYAQLFRPIGHTESALDTSGQFERDAPLGDLALDEVRAATRSQVALTTASTFREAIPLGDVTEESLRTAMPYENGVLVLRLRGETLRRILDESVQRRGTDLFLQVSGVRFDFARDTLGSVRVLTDPSHPEYGYTPLYNDELYRVAVTDFLLRTAPGYRELLADQPSETTSVFVRDLVRMRLASGLLTEQHADGRILPLDASGGGSRGRTRHALLVALAAMALAGLVGWAVRSES